MGPFVYVCILAFLSQARAQTANQRDIEQLTKCKLENNASEDVKEVVDGFVPKTPEGKCMMACFLESNDLMKEGKLDRSGLGIWVKKVLPHYVDTEPITEAIYKECFAPYIEMDKCEAASSFIGCGIKTRLLTWSQE